MRQFSRPALSLAAATMLSFAWAPLAIAQTPGEPGPADAGPACHPGKNGAPFGRITVTGNGESHVAPDTAMISLGVTTQAVSAAEAMTANSEQQAKVIDALKERGIEARDIQTSGLNLSPMMDYGENRAPAVTGYQAQNMVSIRIRDLATLGQTLDTIVAAGANEMNGISFQSEDPQAPTDEARGDAIADARHNAEVLAKAAGVELGPILAIRDVIQGGGGPQPMMMSRAESADAAVPIEAGELELTAQIQVDFALVGGESALPCGPDVGGSSGAATEPPVPGVGEAAEGAAMGDTAADVVPEAPTVTEEGAATPEADASVVEPEADAAESTDEAPSN